MTADTTRKGILLMILAVFLFTVMDAVAKGLIARYPAPQVVWARFAGQAVIVAALLGPRMGPMLRTAHPWLHLWRSAFQLCATGFFFLSLAYIGLPEATALADTSPVLITLGAALFLGEKLGPRRLFGVFAALAGALIIIRPGAEVFQLAALLPLANAVAYAGNALLTRHIGAREPFWTSLMYGALFGALVTGAWLPQVWITPSLPDLGLFFLVGCLGTAAQLCIIRSFSSVEASVVAPFTYLGIVFSTLWSVLFFDDWPDGWTLIGALVIVVAGLYVWHRETLAARKAQALALDD
ncbi:DMT family transporter [Tabrizicola oligotrophica]|uniref:DMT family transporter n=1 Tax=Tabrizicola oligotrophica TaxID=2710650 RepID=A0A6M0QPP6_9RHOB|nr:DMT family transporter [Tabrizicola oligotrophica]NEY89316.1 DMT family transporter [Tabrizicola oligotrophica]